MGGLRASMIFLSFPLSPGAGPREPTPSALSCGVTVGVRWGIGRPEQCGQSLCTLSKRFFASESPLRRPPGRPPLPGPESRNARTRRALAR